MDTVMTPNDVVAVFRNSLNQFHDEAAAFIRSQGTDPLAGSVAAQERATFPNPESLYTVAAIANILLESVGEHVTAFVKTMTEPVEPLACWTCVRSMLESSAIAAWLFEPGIDVKTRVGRAFAHRYEGLEQQVKFAKAIGLPDAAMDKQETHINNVENLAVSLGFTRLRNKNNQRMGIGQVMPSATEIIKRMLDEEQAYRLLSAVAHGHTWALQQLGFRQGASRVSPTDGVSTTELSKGSGTIEGYGYLTTLAAKSLGLPLWYQCVYFGWDQDRLLKLLESIYDQIKAKDGIRFWRARAGTFCQRPGP
jgi:hypothetical protein